MKLPAANDDQKAVPRATIIPIPPFKEKNIPTTPRPSIGRRPYPRVLIILYSGII